MKDDKFNNLNDVFNLPSKLNSESEISSSVEQMQSIDIETTSLEPIKNNERSNDIKKDYDYTRGNLYSIIEKGQEAINGALELAQETEQARAYEVVGQLVKSVADATDKLIDLQKKLKDIEDVKQPIGPTNVTNALFVGSTAELSKLLKSQKNQEKDK